MPVLRDPGFRAFTLKYHGPSNRLITEISIFEAFDPAKPPSSLPTPYKTRALWDTGSTGSVLTKAVVGSLSLVPVGRVNVQHFGGSDTSNTFLVNLFLPNKVGIPGVLVTECQHIIAGCDAIIGMNIIIQGDLAITNVNEKTCMTFRIPSLQTIDYVMDADRITFAGVSRNAPCPCGKKDASGKPIKYKHCHG